MYILYIVIYIKHISFHYCNTNLLFHIHANVS